MTINKPFGHTAPPRFTFRYPRYSNVILEVGGTVLSGLVLMWAACSPTLAQSVGAGRGETVGSGGSSSIQGRVYFPDRGEGKAVRVTIESPDVGTLSTVTDPDGAFIFNGLRSNTYLIKRSKVLSLPRRIFQCHF